MGLKIQIMLLLSSFSGLLAQNNPDSLFVDLKKEGFQHFYLTQSHATLISVAELSNYRNSSDALTKLFAILAQSGQHKHNYVIPSYQGIQLIPHQLKNDSLITPFWYNDQIASYLFTQSYRSKLNNQEIINSRVNRLHLILYPQIKIHNVYFDKTYELQINIAPELQYSLWKGFCIHAQMIIPVLNQHEENENFIRPGIISAYQRFSLGPGSFGMISAGKFTNNRHGLDLRLLQYFAKGRISFGANIGLTGFNEYRDERFIYSSINTFTWKLHAGYFNQHFNSLVNLNFGRCLYGDYGIRVNAIRFFNETAVGFWAMFAGNKLNGGFNFSIPIPPRKYKPNRKFLIRPPSYFFWEYRGRIWPLEGQSYHVQNDFYYFGNTKPLNQFNHLTF
jgi:hypothetical protein